MATHQSLADRTTQLRAEAAALSSSDRLGGLVFKAFDLLGQLQNKELGAKDLEFGLQSFEMERELMKKHDQIPTTPVLSMVYGLVETLYGTVEKMKTEGRIRVKEDNTLFDQSKSTSSGMKGVTGECNKDKEPVQPPPVSAAAATATAAPAAPPPSVIIAAPVTAVAAATTPPAATATTETKKKIADSMELPKDEPIDDLFFKVEDIWGDEMVTRDEEMSNNDAMPALNGMGEEFDLENEGVNATMQDNQIMKEDRERDCSETVETSKNRRSKRAVNRPVSPSTDSEPLAKKAKGESSTTKKTTPQCLQCEAYPSTPHGYIMHLRRHHTSTLSALGVYLLCACGAKFRHATADIKHTDECNNTQYTLHKLTDQ